MIARTLAYVLAAFVVAAIGLYLLGVDEPRLAVPGFRAAVMSLAGSLGTIVGTFIGRRYSDTRCAVCHGVFPSDGAFKGHPCAQAALRQIPPPPPPP